MSTCIRSLLFFSAAVLSFLWTAGSKNDNPTPSSPNIEFIIRISISMFFLLGLLHLILVIRDFRSYRREDEGSIAHAEKHSTPGSTPGYVFQGGGGTTPLLPLYHMRMPLDAGEGWEEHEQFVTQATPQTGVVPVDMARSQPEQHPQRKSNSISATPGAKSASYQKKQSRSDWQASHQGPRRVKRGILSLLYGRPERNRTSRHLSQS